MGGVPRAGVGKALMVGSWRTASIMSADARDFDLFEGACTKTPPSPGKGRACRTQRSDPRNLIQAGGVSTSMCEDVPVRRQAEPKGLASTLGCLDIGAHEADVIRHRGIEAPLVRARDSAHRLSAPFSRRVGVQRSRCRRSLERSSRSWRSPRRTPILRRARWRRGRRVRTRMSAGCRAPWPLRS